MWCHTRHSTSTGCSNCRVREFIHPTEHGVVRPSYQILQGRDGATNSLTRRCCNSLAFVLRHDQPTPTAMKYGGITTRILATSYVSAELVQLEGID
ncbi:hypothetical protein CPSG_03468 [Coccidioides posadasii str. Silveira]|uniref:Uncharacterized protein n=1 Tax=Coccidioides posadasii (strain RMSCC 757 / Silveira) TaxID=443226 RepID=E9D040_COCPS|nr:hypothetical protein CPSG_03468 [Coccidioides posadasii str. Silveira]